jgi:hypothetical protein
MPLSLVDFEHERALGALSIIPSCTHRLPDAHPSPPPDTKTSKARRSGNDATRTLRPAVQDSLGSSILFGDDRALLQQTVESSQLLLILGAPPKSPELVQLTRDLAASIHETYGAVIYVDPEPLQGRHMYDYIDLHLQSDVQEAIAEVMQEMNRVSSWL